MAFIGKIVSMPPHPTAAFAIVSDAYGMNRSVAAESLPSKAKAGDEFAYRLDFSTKGGEQILVPDKEE